MKILRLGSFLFLLALFVTSCSKKDKVTPALNVDKTSLTLPAVAGKDYLQITSNTDWELTGMPAWLTVTPASGKGDTKVELSFSANSTAAERTTNLTLKVAGNAENPTTITAKQSQPDVVINSFTDHAKGGATVTIAGSGFSDKIAENTVTINDQLATVTAASPTSLSVTVPAKAGNGKIKVTVGPKNNISATDFIYDWEYIVSTLVGDGTTTTFSHPFGLAVDGAGNVYFADEVRHKVYKVTPNGTIITLAGNGTAGFKDENGTNAQFNGPTGVTLDANNNVYVADRSNHRIRKITPNGDVTTWAGDGSITNLNLPTGLAFDGTGNMIVADQQQYKIIKITPNTDGSRTFTTVAGSSAGFADGNSTAAKFDWPTDVAIDGNGNIYVADQSNNRIRKITPNGNVTTVIGDGSTTTLAAPIGIEVDNNGNIYTADRLNYRIRKIVVAAGGSTSISTIAGTGGAGYVDGAGATAQFRNPLGLAIGSDGTVYVGDGDAPRIRKIVSQ